jgi:hypothetical protein
MKPYYLTLTESALRELLTKQGLDTAGLERIVTHVQELKRQARSERAYRKQHVKEWRSLLTPLRQEWNNAKVGAAYAPDNALRVAAFDAYAEVLYALHERLERVAFNDVDPIMPSQFATDINTRNAKAGKEFRVPHNGVHWVDWVKPKERAYVERAFAEWGASGTKKKHAKTKEPFKRIDGDKVFAKKKTRLLTAATNERDSLYRQYEAAMQGLAARERQLAQTGSQRLADPSDLHLRLEERLNKARRAVSVLTRWAQDDGALPRTWHGVLTMNGA